jgi:nucleolin
MAEQEVKKKSKKRAREAEEAAAGEAAADSAAAPPAPPAASAADGDATACTVYSEGWPYETTDEQVRDFFAPCGAIVSIKAPRWQDSGRMRGYAHVRFERAAAAAAALALSGRAVGARTVAVKAANPLGFGRAPPPARAPAGCSTLYVSNLPYTADEDAVKKVFQRFGNVASVRIVRRSDTHASKGFAYVEFDGKAGAEGAVAASVAPAGLLVGGRGVRLDYDAGAGPKASFKTADGRAFSRVAAAAGTSSGAGGGKGAGRSRQDAGIAGHTQ